MLDTANGATSRTLNIESNTDSFFWLGFEHNNNNNVLFIQLRAKCQSTFQRKQGSRAE